MKYINETRDRYSLVIDWLKLTKNRYILYVWSTGFLCGWSISWRNADIEMHITTHESVHVTGHKRSRCKETPLARHKITCSIYTVKNAN